MYLFYWSIKGIVEPIRLFQAYFGIKTQEICPNSKNEWDKSKIDYQQKGLEFPNLPFLIVNKNDQQKNNQKDFYLSETKAIAEYLNQNHENSRIDNQEDDILYEMVYENLEKLRKRLFRFLKSKEFDNKQYEELIDDYNQKISDIQKLKMDNQFILNKISYVDFQLFYINTCMEKLTCKLKLENPLQKYQNLYIQQEKMKNHKRIIDYFENDLRSCFSLMSQSSYIINLDD